MILFPAIDIKEGKVVRLLQGKFDKVTEYSKDPIAMAMHWKSLGAKWLHIVDLDGARTGIMANINAIRTIAKTSGIPIQVGGGVRSLEIIEQLVEHKVSRVVLGTKAFEDKEFLKQALKTWPDKIVVSLDCQHEYVMKNGWVHNANVTVWDFIRDLKGYGLKNIVYTDVATDGMMTGPNYTMLHSILQNVDEIKLIASGGIGSLADIENLLKINKEYNGRMMGAITGKAIYEGKLDFKSAVDLVAKHAQ